MKINLQSISFKLIFGGVAATLVPLIIVGFISFSKARTSLTDLSKTQVVGIASDLAQLTRTFIEAEMEKARLLAGQETLIELSEAVSRSDEQNVQPLLENLHTWQKSQYRNMGDHYVDLLITNSDGELLTAVSSGLKKYKQIHLADRDYFKTAKLEGKAAFGDMVLSRNSGKPIVVVCAPIASDGGKFLGVVGAVINAQKFTHLISDRKIGRTGYGILINKHAIVLAHPNAEHILKLDASKIPAMKTYINRMINGETGVEEYVFQGIPKIAGFAPVGTNGWAISASQNQEEFLASSRVIRNANIIVTLLAGVAVAVIIMFAARLIVGPINAAVDGLKDIAQGEGDLTKRLKVSSRDEVGELAKWFNSFMEKLQGIFRDIAGGVETLSSSSKEISAISEQMTQGITGVSGRSGTVSNAAEEMSTNMNTVAAAMEESSTNINMVATAAEQMSSTISEIAQNAEKASSIAGDASRKASGASTNMDELGVAANAIGKVIETITDISEQVNLLALNATIEAARAGDAGKGFAVVANEIKELARQTAAATQDIKEKVESIQSTTSTTVAQISEITQVITDVNEVVTTIATAVEEQSATTKDIAVNVTQASQGLQEVNENVNQSSTVSNEISQDITGVSSAINEMAASSSQVNLSAQDLSRLSETLQKMVDQFKV